MSTILVVDDDVDTLDMYSLLIMSQGHKVLVASSLQKAVEVAYTHKGTIDVLFTDLRLGDGMGSELLHLLGKRLPKSTILITGHHKYPAKLHPGFDDYLTKPVSCELLLKTVDNCVRLHDEEQVA